MFGFKSRFHVCELFGIPLYVDITFLFILLMMVSDFGSLDFGLAMALVLAISITLHELGHSLTARAFGYHTNDITLSLLGGCASLIALPRKAWQELLTAIAGPAVSFLLSALAYFILRSVPLSNQWAFDVLYGVYVMNLMLGTFNLLPALPMDGGRVFRSALRMFMPRVKATYVAMIVGRVLAVALILLPILGVRHIWIFPIGGSFFIRLLIAYMIWQEAWREYQLALSESDFRHWTQRDFNARVSPPPYDR